MAIKIVQRWANCEQNRTERPRTDPCICGTLKYSSGGMRNHWGKRDYSINEAEKLLIHMKHQIGSLQTPKELVLTIKSETLKYR